MIFYAVLPRPGSRNSFLYARRALVAKYILNCRTRVWCERSRVMTPLGVGMVNIWSRGPLFLKTELNLSCRWLRNFATLCNESLTKRTSDVFGLIKKIKEPYFEGTCFKNGSWSFSKTFTSNVKCYTLWWVRKIGYFIKFYTMFSQLYIVFNVKYFNVILSVKLCSLKIVVCKAIHNKVIYSQCYTVWFLISRQ